MHIHSTVECSKKKNVRKNKVNWIIFHVTVVIIY